ncbi:MAG: IS1380 family transposase [Bacteroidetes bacterium]|jgi:hypothetical protein|nr:IS1380 family transposase [Bacteroidota bacterium]
MSLKIAKISSTNEKISGRGGLALFMRYVQNIGLYGLFLKIVLPALPNSNNKGLQLGQFIKQIIAFMMDGTDTSISSFDLRKSDVGYASLLENREEDMASSHQIKRYFSKLSIVKDQIFINILHQLFLWRLQIEKPQIIELGIDTMVLDNDDAHKREGCEVTYKKKKGFQPLHICWGPFLVDVLFRKGSAHSNHGTDYIDRVRALVEFIRQNYSPNVPIIICADSGFADQKAYEAFEEELDIHFITTGKLYKPTKEFVEGLPQENYQLIEKGKAIWHFAELGNRLGSWSKFRRCIFTHLYRDQQGQYVMELGKPDNLIYTNIGQCPKADKILLNAAGGEHYFKAETIVRKSHARGADELIHRSIKELADKEQLPFSGFGMNRAYYLLLVVVHFIFEAYKRDVTAQVISTNSYPNTFRRKLIDFAVKISTRARSTVMKVTNTVFQSINIVELWRRCQSPPPIIASI